MTSLKEFLAQDEDTNPTYEEGINPAYEEESSKGYVCEWGVTRESHRCGQCPRPAAYRLIGIRDCSTAGPRPCYLCKEHAQTYKEGEVEEVEEVEYSATVTQSGSIYRQAQVTFTAPKDISTSNLEQMAERLAEEEGDWNYDDDTDYETSNIAFTVGGG